MWTARGSSLPTLWAKSPSDLFPQLKNNKLKNSYKTMMYQWFECKIKYEKTLDDGKVQKVSEPYLVDAVNFTDAEKRIIEEIQPFMTGAFEVSDIKRVRYSELFEDPRDEADRFYKAKVIFITLDEKSGAEKKTASQMLVQAGTLREALDRLDEGMKTTMMDYTVASIQETALIDVFHYREAIPEGLKAVTE